jgi:hypothetical protein
MTMIIHREIRSSHFHKPIYHGLNPLHDRERGAEHRSSRGQQRWRVQAEVCHVSCVVESSSVLLGKKTRAEGGERPIIVRQLDRNRKDLTPTDPTRSVPSVYKPTNTTKRHHRTRYAPRGCQQQRNADRNRRRRHERHEVLPRVVRTTRPPPLPPPSLSTDSFFPTPRLADGR